MPIDVRKSCYRELINPIVRAVDAAYESNIFNKLVRVLSLWNQPFWISTHLVGNPEYSAKTKTIAWLLKPGPRASCHLSTCQRCIDTRKDFIYPWYLSVVKWQIIQICLARNEWESYQVMLHSSLAQVHTRSYEILPIGERKGSRLTQRVRGEGNANNG